MVALKESIHQGEYSLIRVPIALPENKENLGKHEGESR